MQLSMHTKDVRPETKAFFAQLPNFWYKKLSLQQIRRDGFRYSDYRVKGHHMFKPSEKPSFLSKLFENAYDGTSIYPLCGVNYVIP